MKRWRPGLRPNGTSDLVRDGDEDLTTQCTARFERSANRVPPPVRRHLRRPGSPSSTTSARHHGRCKRGEPVRGRSRDGAPYRLGLRDLPLHPARLCDDLWSVDADVQNGHRLTGYPTGHIAKLAGYPRHSRHVGNALKELPEGSSVPWHRVISSKGLISPRPASGGLAVARQRERLIAEGVEVTTQRGAGVALEAGAGGAERIDLRRWGWFPESLP